MNGPFKKKFKPLYPSEKQISSGFVILKCFPTVPNQCVWIDIAVTLSIWWGLSFPSEPWWGLVRRDMSLEYERRNKESKVCWMAFIQTFLDWDILCLSFPPPAPTSPLTIWSILWLFASVRGYPCSRSAAVSVNGKRTNQSWTVRGNTVQMCEGGRTREGLNLHLYMNVDALLSTC